MAALMKLRPRIREGVVVLIFADGGDKYLSTPTWSGP
jgi:cysteine synthase